MVRINDPMHVQHPQLQQFAWNAAYYVKIAEAIEDLNDLCDDLPDEERFAPARCEGWYEDVDSVAAALHLLITNDRKGREFLEEMISMWLAEDPEHWAILRLTVILPWYDVAGGWRTDVP